MSTGVQNAGIPRSEPKINAAGMHVTELTRLLREGPAGDLGRLASMRVFAHRERPHPGAQLTLFEAEDGWRYSLWVTNLPAALRGWRANPACIDAAHRVHARVEDGIRTGKELRHRPVPLRNDGDEQGMVHRRPARRRPPHPWRLRAAAEIQASWPWARDIVTAWERISALARATGCPMRTLLSGAVFPCL